jgi:PAS domain S-box-containing protein
LYIASSQISHAVVRSRTRQELLDAVVRVLVEAGGFAMAFAAWYDPASNQLRPVARFGAGADYADRIQVFADERPEGLGPAGMAFRSGACYICQDFQDDPRTAPWREMAAVYGWHATASIPLTMSGMRCGIVAAYARETGIFGSAETALFEQVAVDVSAGLDRLESEEKRLRAQSALGASERRLKLAMDAAAISIYEWDMITGQVVWDERGVRLFGYEPKGFTATYEGFIDRIHPDDRAGVERVMAVATQDRAPFVHEFRIVWPDGSVHWISSRGEFSFNEGGQPVLLRGATFNIDDRMRAEAALGESEERLRQAVRASGIGIFDHDHTQNTFYWSPEMRALYGVDAGAPVNLETYQSRVHPGDRDRIAEYVRRAHTPGCDGLFDVEHRILLPDGKVRWNSIRSQTFFEGQGAARHPVRTVGAATDITGRKTAEEERQKLASLVEMSQEFIGIATLDAKIVYLNNAAMRLTGIESLEEARGLTIFDFLREEDRPHLAGEVYPAVMNEGFWAGELRLRHFGTGAAIDVDVAGFQIRDDQGAPLYISAVMRDVTERKRAAAEKARLEESLLQAQKMESIGRLAGGVAHDFNNMLTVILGFAELAKSRAFEPEILRSHLDEIVKAAERSRQLTRQLLGFSRRQIIAPKPLDLNSMVEDLRSPLGRLIGEDVQLVFSPEPNLWKALLDSAQVNQILLNLAVNAREAMPNGGNLIIETANIRVTGDYARTQANCTPGEYVMVAIRDTGSGMSRETQAHIFEPFFTTKEGKGTGLGLATVYGIVKQNGGFVSFDSEPGQGTAFRLYFPKVDNASESAEPPRVSAKPGAGGVLLVEDDDLVRAVTTAALESIGYTPLVAASAEEALCVCAEYGADIKLILTDVVMPGMTGAELRDRVSELLPEVKVLFMSGYTSDVIVTHGVLKSGVRFIQKPFNIEELGAKIAEMLGSAAAGASG